MAGNVIVRMLPFKDPRSKNRANSNAAHIDYIGRRSGTDMSITDESLHRMVSASALYSISEDERNVTYIGTRPGTVKKGDNGYHPYENEQGVHGEHLDEPGVHGEHLDENGKGINGSHLVQKCAGVAPDFDYEKGDKSHLQDHGLFGEYGVPDISAVRKEVRGLKHTPMYRFVISITDETAADLGFTTKEAWESLVRSETSMLAKNLLIPPENMAWVAALHLKEGHPHVHLSVWDRTDSKRFRGLNTIPKDNLKDIRIGFTKAIYAGRRLQLYALKTASRDMITEMLKNDVEEVRVLLADKEHVIAKDISMPEPSREMVDYLSAEISELSQIMPGHGRASYEYMPEEVKAAVDEITSKLLINPFYSEQLQKVHKVVSELSGEYSKNEMQIKQAVDNATDDIKKRMSQILLKAAAGLSQDNCKAKFLWYLFRQQTSVSHQPMSLGNREALTFLKAVVACEISSGQARILLNRYLSNQSIACLQDYFKVGNMNELLDKVYSKQFKIQPDEMRELFKRIDHKGQLEEDYARNMERRIINTVSMGALRAAFSLFNRNKEQCRDHWFVTQRVNPRKTHDALYSKEELN